ncbi:pentapeptide repeat-containing protein, partial [Salmonella enterica subsp. enterica serovar Kentucky]|nr:pentapeptide repeat-containing protein [Salmonella enterica subsp. enterica serovar Kentucky]
DTTDADPVAVVRAMYPYIERELSQGAYLGHITRHMLGLFQGMVECLCSGANMEHANISGATLIRADMSGATLQGATIMAADM